MDKRALMFAAMSDPIRKKAAIDSSLAVNKGLVKNIIVPEVTNQFDFTRAYVNSPKYSERLAKMVNAERGLQGTLNPNNNFSSELLSGYKQGQNTSNIIADVVKTNNENLNTVSDKIRVGDFDLGRNVAGKYDSSYGDIRINESLTRDNPTVPVHELSHSVNRSKLPYSTGFEKKYLDPILKSPGSPGWEPEVQKPGEIKARIDAVRYLMMKNGIVDPGKEDVTPEHIKKLNSIKGIDKDFNYKQLKDQIKDDKKTSGLMWLLNNIAKVQHTNTQNGSNA